jgi:hypothetical protein
VVLLFGISVMKQWAGKKHETPPPRQVPGRFPMSKLSIVAQESRSASWVP